MKEFAEEIIDEAGDFFEDLWEHLLRKKSTKIIDKRDVNVRGVITKVRPAYIFAERIENLIRLLFGLSVVISGITASLVGFTSLSDLVESLINTLSGRILM